MKRPTRGVRHRGGPRRIAFLHDNVEFGGIETLQIQELRHLDGDRYRGIVVAAPYASSTASQFRDRLAAINVTMLTAGEPRNLSALSGVRTAWNLQQLLRREQVDVAHVQTRTPSSSRQLTLGACLAFVPAIVRTEHVSPGPHLGRFSKHAIRPLDWMTDLVITDSKADRQEQIDLVGRRPSKVLTSYCGIDPSEFDPSHDVEAAKVALGLDPAVPVVGSVGRLHEQKGHRYLVEAAAQIIERHPGPVTFLLVGDGQEEEALRSLAASRGITEHILFAGFQPDATLYMQAMDVVAMPSLWEGFSISMQEFMALGKAMVVSDHHSFREAMDDGEHGLIVPMRDGPALADAIIKLLADEGLRRKLGEAAVARARREFSIQRHVDELMDAYDALLDGRSVHQGASSS